MMSDPHNAGIVQAVGANVEKYQPGDRVGVGCIVESCGTCDQCCRNNEQYCLKGKIIFCFLINLDSC